MGSSLLGVSISGLNAAQSGLVTTSHNISNANTPNYSRQEVIQAANPAQFFGSGFIGQGVHVETVRRVFSDNLELQIQQNQAATSQLDTYLSQIKQIDNLLADPSAGLSPVLNDFFSAIQNVAASPTDNSARQVAISSAQSLATRFIDVSTQIEQLRSGVNDQVNQSVSRINAYSQQIADLNQRIVLAQGSSGQEPNDLLDQRDAIIGQLNQEIGTISLKQSDGSVNILTTTGLALVLGNQVSKLSVVPDAQDPSNQQVALQVGSTTVRVPTSSLQGGNLTGAFQFRDESLNPTENALGRVAIALANTFNAQHQLGQDKNGQLGTAFFGTGSPQIISNTNNSATGAISASISSVSSLTTSDYKLQYNGTNYLVTRLSDNTVQTFASLPQTVDGVTLSVTSALTTGDSFIIEPTRTGASQFSVLISDPAKVAAASPVRASSSAANTGGASVSSLSVVPPPPTNASLQVPVNINFHVVAGVTTYDLVNATTSAVISSGNAYTAGTPITANGWSLSLTGAPADNDSFGVGPNTNGVTDSANALLLAGLQTSTVVAGTTYQGAYAQMVSDVGTTAHELDVTSQAQASLLSQAKQTRESVSGVNLDEEAANLLRYQQAYQAAGKAIATAGVLFNTVLGLFS